MLDVDILLGVVNNSLATYGNKRQISGMVI